MATAKKIINQAKKWIGKNEGDGSFKVIIDTYNEHKPLARSYKVKYTDEWCATFISALAIKCGATDIIPTECSCQKMIELFKKLGTWVENEDRKPNVGDIIFYDWQDDGKGDNKGWSDHVGIVESVQTEYFTIIEGNISRKVGRRTLHVNAKYIRGFAVPKYETETSSFLPKRGYFKKGDVHENVGKVAAFMYKTFPAYTNEKALGNVYGTYLIKAITEFQERTGLETDGYLGPLTLGELQQYGFKY